MSKNRISLGVFADGHLTNSLPYTVSGDKVRISKLENYIVKFFSTISKEKVDGLIIPGDLLNSSKLDPDDVEILTHFFYELYCRNINTVLCLGNHDIDGNSSALRSAHGVGFFSKLVRVYDGLFFTHRDESREGVQINYNAINFCSHKKFLTSVENIISTRLGEGFNILIGHIGVKGALHGSTKSLTGVKQEDIERISKHFDLVVLGHFHKYQWLTDNCFYPGAIHQTRLDEEGEIPGGGIVTLEKGKNPVFKKIENKFSPRFITVKDYIHSPEEIKGNIVKPILDTEGKSEEDNLVFLKSIQKNDPYFLIKPRTRRTFSIERSSGESRPSSKRIALLKSMKEIVGDKKKMKPMYEHTMGVWKKAKEEVGNV